LRPAEGDAKPTEAAAADPKLPSFDVVRVEPSGESVIAGRASPGATVELLRNGQPFARVVADASGLFAFVPPPLPEGSHEIVLQATSPEGGSRARSAQSVTVVIGKDRKQAPLVTVTAPDQPTVVLSKPEDPPAPAPGASAPAVASAARPETAPKPAEPPPPAPPTKRPDIRIAIVEAEGTGRLFVSGQAAPGATIRLYLNDAFVAPGGTGPDGRLSFSIERGIRPGEYRVRLDDVDPVTGAVKSRAEVPFTVPPPPPVAVAAAPPGRAPEVPAAAGRPAPSSQPERGTENQRTPPPSQPERADADGRTAPDTRPAPGLTSRDAPASPSGTRADPRNSGSDTRPAPGLPDTSRDAPPSQSGTQADNRNTLPDGRPAPGTASREAPPQQSEGRPVTPGGAPETRSVPDPRIAAQQPPTPQAGAQATTGAGPRPAGPAPSPVLADPGLVVVPEVNTAIVARGDNLWSISKRVYGRGLRYTVIFDANTPQIRNPDLIYPGQVFVLPGEGGAPR
jgi:nucleoid-associated protein YgaU